MLAVITDLHFGARQDSLSVAQHQYRFYHEVFFPYIDAHPEITGVLCLGDTFDRRKYTNHASLNSAFKALFEPLAMRDMPTWMILGNHDIYYRASLSVNTPDLFLRGFPNIHVIDKPTELEFDDKTILALPWICDENAEECYKAVEASRSDIMVAHLELAGFEMYRGFSIDRGMDHKIFAKFDKVLSGHYHHRSTRGNIHYLGSPYETTWADYGDPRGFHTLDVRTNDLTFIENPLHLFEVVTYDDADVSDYSQIELSEQQCDALNQRYVKIAVKNKSNAFFFDRFVKDIEQLSPISVQVSESYNFKDDMDSMGAPTGEAKDPLDYLIQYLDENVIGSGNPRGHQLKNLVNDLYQSASALTQD